MDVQASQVTAWSGAMKPVTPDVIAEADTECPKGFRVQEDGIYFEDAKTDKDGNTSSELVRVASKIEVIAKTRDENSENWGRLLKLSDSDGVEKRWAMPAEMLKGNGDDVRGNLLSMGAEIEPGSKQKQNLTRYIQSSNPTARASCVSKTGWFNGVFVLPDRNIGNCKEIVIYQSESFSVHLLGSEGTLDEWKEQVSKPCVGNTRPVAAICKAFSAPLHGLVGAPNSGIHFRGPSSIGKSITLKVAASVFGDPEQYVKTWHGTINGIEATAYLHNDLPLILDEIGQADGFSVGETTYALMNGVMKQRAQKSGRARKNEQWRVGLISSGEVSLAQKMDEVKKKVKAGQEVRLVEIQADTGNHGIFDVLNGYGDGRQLADQLTKACEQQYGTAGEAYLQCLVKDTEKWTLRAKQHMHDFESTYPSLPPQAGRVLKQFALMAAAGEIATEMGLTGWSAGEAVSACNECFGGWLESRGQDHSFEETQAVSQLRSFIESNEKRFDRFIRGTGYTTTTAYNRAGFAQVEPGAFDENFEVIEEFLVFPEVFKNDVCAGLDFTGAKKFLAKKGILKTDSSGKSSTSRSLPGLDKKRRVYVIDAKRLYEEHDLISE